MFDEPTFLIQVGHHGANRVGEAIDHNNLGGAILSPTDYKPGRNDELAGQLRSEGLIKLFDPQFYLPGQGDRKDLNEYDFHDEYGGDDFSSSLFYDPRRREDFSKVLINDQDDYDTDAYITPSPYISDLSTDEIDDWRELSGAFVQAVESYGRDIPIFVSLPINGDRLSDSSARNYLLNTATELDVDGFYVSVSYSNKENRLPLQGGDNLRAYLDLMSTLKLNRYEVLAGHTHQVAHLLFPIGVDAIASGHYKNLRNFDHERWIVPDEDEIRRTVARYYSDELLTSIRPDGLLDELAQDSSFDVSQIRTDTPYDSDLFDGPVSPANAGWGKAEGAWDHYTAACNKIATTYRGKDLDARLNLAKAKVSKAAALHRKISANIDEHVDEIDPQVYEDWENMLEYFEGTPEFQRLNRIV